ncbi:MAG: hypothetical protein IJH94_06390, partial [Clostridia bacterium]|nr:hypothetical protein [Clostridia bacterium]
MKRKLIGILTAAAMLLPCVPQLWVTASADGGITAISNASGLQALATEVNNGTSYAGNKIKLTADIQLSGTWTPIGNIANKFEGTFDGQGHIISGLSVSAENAFCQGLFGYVDGGTIKNLTVTGTVNVSATSTGGQIGGIVGYLNGVDAKVISCKSEVTVSAPSYSTAVGGVVGVNASGTVADCYSTGAVEGGYNIGGIVGWNYGTVSNCHHYQGAVTIDKGGACGNIVGENDGDVEHCYYLSTLEGSGIGANGSSYGSDDASPLSAEAFRTQSSFQTWDFTNTWTMGSSYPVLQYNPYAGFTNHIKTVEQLEMLCDVINNSVTSMEIYDTYYLDNDLDLSGISDWTPIGTFYDRFDDTFTGWDPELRRETVRTITGLTI